MPLRVPKPHFRIDRLSDRYRVSYFTSIDRRLLRRGHVELPLNDFKGFAEELAPFTAATMDRAQTKGK